MLFYKGVMAKEYSLENNKGRFNNHLSICRSFIIIAKLFIEFISYRHTTVCWERMTMIYLPAYLLFLFNLSNLLLMRTSGHGGSIVSRIPVKLLKKYSVPSRLFEGLTWLIVMSKDEMCLESVNSNVVTIFVISLNEDLFFLK